MRQAWMFFERRGEGALALFRQMMPGDRKRELLQSERNIAASLKQSIPVIDSVQVSGQWPVDITQEEPPVSRKYIGNQTVTLNTPSRDYAIFGEFFQVMQWHIHEFCGVIQIGPTTVSLVNGDRQ